MDDKLRNLKHSMKKTVFKDLVFTDKHQKAIQRTIKSENVLIHLLQLLVTEKTGIELIKLLRARRVSKFEEQEGFLYTVLHQLEQDALLTSRWDDDSSKYYVLNKKGLKVLKAIEKSKTEQPSLKKLLEGENV